MRSMEGGYACCRHFATSAPRTSRAFRTTGGRRASFGVGRGHGGSIDPEAYASLRLALQSRGTSGGSTLLVLEDRLPIAARWTLYALGSVEGQRVRRPRDPVAAWLLRRHPQLLPTFASPSVLAMIRACASLVDRMIEEEVHRARIRGETLVYHGFGGGFDARWYRLTREMRDVVRAHREVDEPDVLNLKDKLLSASSFAELWSGIVREGSVRDRWTVTPTGQGRPLVVMEGAATRLGADGLLTLLARVRREAPNAHVLVDLPGFLGPGPVPTRPTAAGTARARWLGATSTGAATVRSRQLLALGYRIVEDTWLAARPELRAPSGMPICPGMEAIRVLRLHPG